MFNSIARTFILASGFYPARHQKDLPHSWYREDLRTSQLPKRWEDWK